MIKNEEESDDSVIDAEYKEINSFDINDNINSDNLLNNPLQELIQAFKNQRTKTGKHKNAMKKNKKKRKK